MTKKAIGLLGTRERTDCFSTICLSYIQEQYAPLKIATEAKKIERELARENKIGSTNH